MLTEPIINQLENRGISGETASRLGWLSSGEMLAIPYFQGDNQVGVKYRTLVGDKRFFQEKGSVQCFYNWNALRDVSEEAIIITEGEMDCAIALQCGHLAVSVPNGAPSKQVENGDRKYEYLADFPSNRTAILAFDSDANGRNLLHDVSLRLGQHRCKWVRYPDGCKDLNEVFLMHGHSAVTEAINKAQWLKIDGIYCMSELPEPPVPPTVESPIPGTSSLYKLRGGDLAVITGIPGFGKTTVVNEIAASCARLHGWNVAIASFEQNPRIDHLRSLRTYYHGIPVHAQSSQAMYEADEWIDRKFTFIVPDSDNEVTLKWVLDKCEASILRNHCKLIVIDPWNEMDHDYPSGMTLTQYTGFAIKQFKKLARKYLVHVIVIAHPAKLQRNRDGEYPVPTLYDIADSSHWYNKPDMGIIIHRNEDNSLLFRVQKCRYVRIIGNVGEVSLLYDRECNRFSLANQL